MRPSRAGHLQRIVSVAFSPDGKRIVSGSYDGILKIWDASLSPEAVDPGTRAPRVTN
jgi:WD40 repeat protein